MNLPLPLLHLIYQVIYSFIAFHASCKMMKTLLMQLLYINLNRCHYYKTKSLKIIIKQLMIQIGISVVDLVKKYKNQMNIHHI